MEYNASHDIIFVSIKHSAISHWMVKCVGLVIQAEDDNQADHGPFMSKVLTLFAVVDDVLAEQVVVAEHHRGAQCGEMLLHPHHLLLQHRLAGNLLLDSGQRHRERQISKF